MNVLAVILSMLNLQLVFIHSYNFNSLTDFDYNNNNNLKDTVKVRTKFLNTKKQNERIELFDKINSNKTVYIDNILHLLSNNALEVLKIEESFRNVLAMKGVKYTFKRDFYWRTWRQVDDSKGVVCYKCQSKETGKCQNGGYWVNLLPYKASIWMRSLIKKLFTLLFEKRVDFKVVEENPPCPYEIYSLKTHWEMCVGEYNRYPDPISTCPSTINRLHLGVACDNPIKTVWRIVRKFDEVSERSSVNVICQGRESCEILTLYTVLPDMIIFRIINSTNHIFYSRVMKSDSKNYVCIEDCGKIDPKTNLVSKNEQPYRLDLFKKNKREDLLSLTSVSPVQKKKCSKMKYSTVYDYKKIIGNFLHGPHLTNEIKISLEEIEHMPYLFNVKHSVTKSNCKILQEKYNEIENSRSD